jgi:hypothetical protein
VRDALLVSFHSLLQALGDSLLFPPDIVKFKCHREGIHDGLKVEEPFILRVPNLSFKIPLLLFPGLQRGWETLGTPFIFFSASNTFTVDQENYSLGVAREICYVS